MKDFLKPQGPSPSCSDRPCAAWTAWPIASGPGRLMRSASRSIGPHLGRNENGNLKNLFGCTYRRTFVGVECMGE